MEDGFFGNFQLDNQESLIVPILNLSTGGLKIAIPRKKRNKFRNGDLLKLVSVVGTANLNFKSDIASEVIAIQEQFLEGYISADCKFLNPAEEAYEQILRLIDSERKLRGQYG